MKLEINNKRVIWKIHKYVEIIQQTPINNQWVKEEIITEIRKYFWDKRKQKHSTKIYGMQRKECLEKFSSVPAYIKKEDIKSII